MKQKPVRLRVLRAEHDRTQMSLARAARLNVTRYWQIENGEGLAPSENEKKSIARVFGVSPDEIAWPECAAEMRAS